MDAIWAVYECKIIYEIYKLQSRNEKNREKQTIKLWESELVTWQFD